MPVRCGIDLGTTYSAISWYDAYNSRVETIELVDSAGGARTIRSVVYYPGGGNPVVVGDTAWNAKQQYPDRVIDHIKRSMGTNYRAPAIDGVEYTPQQVSAEILKMLVKDAQSVIGEEITDVVITVPAYFGEPERAATEEAGKLAGLNVLALLEEPHAAALAYAIDKVADIVDKHLLVYDLGGGTFDVTLIHATAPEENGKVRLKIDTLCKGGDRALGGLNWDDVLAEVVAGKAQQQYGLDLRNDARRNALLLDQCEKAKRHLSQTPTVPIVVEPPDKVVEVTQGEFEDASRDLLNQTQMFLEQVLRDAESLHGVTKDRIDVMLTGGSSKMPGVKTMIEGVTGKPPFRHRNLELLVTVGAAYWAYLMEGHSIDVAIRQDDGSVKKGGLEVIAKPSDISTYSIGVEVLRGDGQGGHARLNSIVLPRGARSGEAPVVKELQTSEDGMTEIPITLYQGESANIDECQQLMVVTIGGLPADRPRGQRVKVSLGYDTNGILRGSAVDVSSSQQAEIVIDRS
jgi:molecular chaperone DnaK